MQHLKLNPNLIELFYTFMKIGAFTFGGGYAMIAFMNHICIQKKHWITDDEMLDVSIIAESTPGPMSVNIATYVGYKTAGFAGACFATLGLILPSFIFICMISSFLNSLMDIPFIARAFSGMKPAVCLLIIDAALNMLSKLKKNRFSVSIFVISFVIMLLINLMHVDVSSISLMAIAAFISLFCHRPRIRNRKGGMEH